MRTVVTLLVVLLSFPVFGQNSKAVTLRSILLEQLHTTHDQKDWFVPIDVAVDGVTAEQATWKDGSGNHSVGQLTYHLLFWNQRELVKFKGEPEKKFSGNNDETFNDFDTKKWNDTVKQLNQVMSDLEKLVETMDEQKLQKWAPEIARMGTHNAYHIGQIVFLAKHFRSGEWKSLSIPRNRSAEFNAYLAAREVAAVDKEKQLDAAAKFASELEKE